MLFICVSMSVLVVMVWWKVFRCRDLFGLCVCECGFLMLVMRICVLGNLWMRLVMNGMDLFMLRFIGGILQLLCIVLWVSDMVYLFVLIRKLLLRLMFENDSLVLNGVCVWRCVLSVLYVLWLVCLGVIWVLMMMVIFGSRVFDVVEMFVVLMLIMVIVGLFQMWLRIVLFLIGVVFGSSFVLLCSVFFVYLGVVVLCVVIFVIVIDLLVFYRVDSSVMVVIIVFGIVLLNIFEWEVWFRVCICIVKWVLLCREIVRLGVIEFQLLELVIMIVLVCSVFLLLLRNVVKEWELYFFFF